MGNGESIRVWGDKWLPFPSIFRVSFPRLFLHVETRVSELISQDSATWRTPIIDAVFLPHEADLIKSIPLSLHLPDDKLEWAGTSNGLFSVHSAYKVAVEESRPSNTGTSLDSSRNHRFGSFFGAYKYLTKYAILHGKLVEVFYLQRKIYCRKGFRALYCIPKGFSLGYCPSGGWHDLRKEGEVVIPMITFIEGGIRLPMGGVTRDYLIAYRICPH